MSEELKFVRGVHIGFIPHDKQSYDTSGDWFVKGSTLNVLVSDMPDPRAAYLVAIHELIEAVLCLNDGVEPEAVTEFDLDYEEARQYLVRGNNIGVAQFEDVHGNSGQLTRTSEPGDHPAAPYHRQHCIATGVERILCASLGLSWDDYEQIVYGVAGEGH